MDIEAVHYDAKKALQIATGIARPRRVGSRALAHVGCELASTLEQAGYQVQAESFQFADACSAFLILEILAFQGFVALTIWLCAVRSPVRLATSLLLILMLAMFPGLNRRVQAGSLVVEGRKLSTWARLCQRLGRRYHASNYVAKMPVSSTAACDTHLLLVAHYDSKSQRIPLAARMTVFGLGIGGALLFAVLSLISTIEPGLTAPALAFGGLALLAGVPLWFLDLGDDSPGAIDNASSVGVVVELAQALFKHPEICRKLGLTILLTSAEEASTMGTVAYVQRHEVELRCWAKSRRVYVLNFDGVGVNGSLYWTGHTGLGASPSEPCLMCLVRQACEELDYKIKTFNLPGALYDHMPFAALGLDAGTLVAVGRASLGVHTRRDSADQLSLRGFARAGQVALKVIHALLNN